MRAEVHQATLGMAVFPAPGMLENALAVGPVGSDATQRALLNILEDFSDEQHHFAAAQRALLNILEDFEEEKRNLHQLQSAVLNILDDFDQEKSKVELLNTELREEMQNRERVQQEVEKLNRELEQRVLDRTADLEASNRELEAFSYSMSHDLRAPLRGINGLCQILLDDYAGKLDTAGQDLLRRVRAASQHMDSVIDGVLELLQTIRSPMRRTRVDLSTLADSIASALQKHDPTRQIEFVIAPRLEVNADPELLHLVLSQLLGNAWKFTSKNPQARIEVGMLEEHGEPIYFVRDDGVGFDMAHAGKLFEAFQRLHSPTEFEGIGIGLATVQRIIRRHGGRVWAEADVGRGATVFFTVPIEPRGRS